ncbi:MAG: helix-turn-helix domain-containing protein [Chloroflexota bacterium]|nr:helix-turn-helix domain-containing protein [Chloroflexota bacterium]
MVNEEWLTVQEAADRLKVHPETIRVWLRDGRLKGTQPINRRVGWRIPSSELNRLLPLYCPNCGEPIPLERRAVGEFPCDRCGQVVAVQPDGEGRIAAWNRGERIRPEDPKAAA